MPQSHRDHGVAGQTHWLLDAELSPRSDARPVRPPRPALLRKEARAGRTPPVGGDDEAQTGESALFALGFVVAFAIYLLFRATDPGGALQDRLSSERSGRSVAVTVAEPEARLVGSEVAALRALLGTVPTPDRVRRESRPARSSTPVQQKAPKEPKPPTTEEPILPVQPPAPLPAPDPVTLLPEPLQPRNVIEDLERATGLEPATLSLEGWPTGVS
jgi:hypothetical protein